MSSQTITVEAAFENGVFRPTAVLSIASPQAVTLVIQLRGGPNWPPDVAEIYQEIAEEDKALARTMWTELKNTWPPAEDLS